MNVRAIALVLFISSWVGAVEKRIRFDLRTQGGVTAKPYAMENGEAFRLIPGLGLELYKSSPSTQAYIGLGGGIADRSTILMGGSETFGYEGSLLSGIFIEKRILAIRCGLGAELDVTYNSTRFSADKTNSPKMGDDYTYIKGLDQVVNACPQVAFQVGVDIFQIRYSVGFNTNIWKFREIYSSMRSEETKVYEFEMENGIRHTFAFSVKI